MKPIIFALFAIFSVSTSAFANGDLDQFFTNFPSQVTVIRSHCYFKELEIKTQRLDAFGVSKNDKNQWTISATAQPTTVRHTITENSRYEISMTSQGHRIDLHNGVGPRWTLILRDSTATLNIGYEVPGSEERIECYYSNSHG